MSWLSKWWKNGGREVVRDGLRQVAGEKIKREVLIELRVLLGALDRLEKDEIRREIERAIAYVEAL